MLYNLVRVYTTTTGQSDLTLGSAVAGFLTFAEAGVPNGTNISYGIRDGNYSEVGAGTLTGGHSIADDASAGVSSGVPAGPLDVPITAFGLLVTGANTGTAQLRLRSETTAVTELLAAL